MRRGASWYQDIFLVLYDFLRPTSSGSTLEMAIGALSGVEVTYLVEAELALRDLGFDAHFIGANYRADIFVEGLVLLMINFLYFYPKRSIVDVAPRPQGICKKVISGILLFPLIVIGCIPFFKGLSA